jgi:hypothetical protein
VLVEASRTNSTVGGEVYCFVLASRVRGILGDDDGDDGKVGEVGAETVEAVVVTIVVVGIALLLLENAARSSLFLRPSVFDLSEPLRSSLLLGSGGGKPVCSPGLSIACKNPLTS